MSENNKTSLNKEEAAMQNQAEPVKEKVAKEVEDLEEEEEEEEEESGSEYDSDDEGESDEEDDYSDDYSDDEEGEEMKADGSAGMSKMISALMDQEGPFVKAIILHTNGEVEERTLDMTPKQATLHKVLGGTPTFLGQWDEKQVIIAHLADNSKLPVNQHSLPYPFDEEKVQGDLVLLRMDDNAEPQDFSLEEWQEFLETEAEIAANGPPMLTGTVESYDIATGSGVLLADDGETRVHVDHSQIHTSSPLPTLLVGEPVQFLVACDEDETLIAFQVTGPDGAFVKGATLPAKATSSTPSSSSSTKKKKKKSGNKKKGKKRK